MLSRKAGVFQNSSFDLCFLNKYCLITILLLFHSEFFGEQFDSSVAFQKLVLLLRVPVHLETVT